MSVTQRDTQRRYLHSHFDTLRNMHGIHARQLIVYKQLRELFSPTCNGLGYGGAHSGLENGLNLSMT
jgi:hypothetical protein